MDLNMHLEERAPDCAQITMTTYTSDVSGVASALYELGGMTVIHDASGCNSTYSTHDEPRWETMNSAVFISALNEMDAVLGNEALLTENLIDAVKRLDPAFTALAGTIIPMMTGSDLRGMAADVEAATGVPAFALSTNGMRAYSIGAAQAWIELARRFVPREAPAARLPRTVNLLGATPLDFSIGGEIDSIRSLLEHAGIRVLADWAMGSTLEDLRRTREAALNIVVSSAGLPLAQVFSRHFGMPFLTALPIGEAGAHRWLDLVESALERALAFPLPEAERDLSHALGRANDRVHPEAAAGSRALFPCLPCDYSREAAHRRNQKCGSFTSKPFPSFRAVVQYQIGCPIKHFSKRGSADWSGDNVVCGWIFAFHEKLPHGASSNGKKFRLPKVIAVGASCVVE